MPPPRDDHWSPAQYARFAAERARAFYDLCELVRPAPAMRVIDLGCGTGKLTRELHQRLSAASTLGVDSSPAMLREAAALAPMPGLRFAEREILEQLEGDAGEAGVPSFDLVFSNAALHWVADHPRLFAALCERVAPGGQLAVQVPANHDQPSHLAAAAVACQRPYAQHLGGYRGRRNVLHHADYARLLHRLGFVEQTVRLEVYGHQLASAAEVAEWTRGTTLTGYFERLPAALRAPFEAAYRKELAQKLPDAETQPYFFPFSRILLWARR